MMCDVKRGSGKSEQSRGIDRISQLSEAMAWYCIAIARLRLAERRWSKAQRSKGRATRGIALAWRRKARHGKGNARRGEALAEPSRATAETSLVTHGKGKARSCIGYAWTGAAGA